MQTTAFNITRVLFVLVSGLVMTGCDLSPSEAEISAALHRQNAEEQKAAMDIAKGIPVAEDAARMFAASFHRVKKMGCSKDTAGEAYICDLEINMSIGENGPGNILKKVRFSKAPSGWEATRYCGEAMGGCDASPSEVEIIVALHQQIAEEQKAAMDFTKGSPLAKNLVRMFAVTLHGAKKIGCSKDTAGEAYICDIELKASTGDGEPKSGPGRFRFIKTSRGWVAGRY